MSSIPVGILGATGMVGQQFIALLADHPWFKVEWLGASQRSEGKAFRDAAAWRLPNRLPEEIATKTVEAAAPGNAPKLMFSEVNADHLGLLKAQNTAQGWKGSIITNPNCATIVLAMALAPLRQFGL